MRQDKCNKCDYAMQCMLGFMQGKSVCGKSIDKTCIEPPYIRIEVECDNKNLDIDGLIEKISSTMR